VRRLTILLVLGSFATVGGTAFAAAPQRLPSRPRTYSIVLKSSGDEYEDAQNKVLNGTDGTKCPPSHDVPSVKAKCWTWSAKHLGHGTYTQADAKFEVGRITWTFTFTDSHRDTLRGNGYAPGVMPDPTPVHAIGHVNRFPGEIYTFTRGTGRFAGVKGLLNGVGMSVVVSVDAATGITHKKGTDKAVGKLTFRSKL
jgi:hypothetical protein